MMAAARESPSAIVKDVADRWRPCTPSARVAHESSAVDRGRFHRIDISIATVATISTPAGRGEFEHV
jgi:hypothetical protein